MHGSIASSTEKKDRSEKVSPSPCSTYSVLQLIDAVPEVSFASGHSVVLAMFAFFFGGGGTLLGKQAVAALSVFAYSFSVAFILGWIINKTIGFRINRDAEVEGIDLNEHSETAYEFDTQSSSGAIPSGQLTGAHARHEARNEGDRE